MVTIRGKVCVFITLLSFLLFSCETKDLYNGSDNGTPKEFNEFDFSTTQDVNLQISYQNMGGIQASVSFEVYDQMPVEDLGYKLEKKEGVEPIYAGRTEADGTFSKTMNLPAYVKTLYVYSPAFYARTLLQAEVTDGNAVASDAEPETKATRAGGSTNKNYATKAVTEDGWKTYLGEYDSSTGKVTSWRSGGTTYPGYAYSAGDLKFTSKQVSALYQAHSAIINSSKSCPDAYRASRDMYINEDAEIAVTMLGGNTCWNSSMGYYYYKTGEAPASLDKANVILIYPNTQDGKWENGAGNSSLKNTIGVDRGTSVQLMYYPNIASGNKTGATTVFPAGMRIGFVLATNAWTGRISGFSADKKYRAATSSGLSVDNNGQKYAKPRTAVYRYNSEEEGVDAVMFSFEDHVDDENFSDVVFTLKSNPVKAIDDIPVVKENKTTVKTLRGVYAFEDLWPSKGDYDMNDVLVVNSYEKVYDASTLNKGIYEETFYFKVLQNVAANQNGLGITLDGCGANAEIKLTVDGENIPYIKKDGDVVLITDNVKQIVGKNCQLKVTYAEPIKKDDINGKVFIWKDSSNGLWEVHIAMERPTPLADYSYFGLGDDASDVSKNIYYVRKADYPFAFFLAGATEQSVSKLLIYENESKAIESVYPEYAGWVTSKGRNNSNWYNK